MAIDQIHIPTQKNVKKNIERHIHKRKNYVKLFYANQKKWLMIIVATDQKNRSFQCPLFLYYVDNDGMDDNELSRMMVVWKERKTRGGGDIPVSEDGNYPK